jgi:hypothetical protein
MWLLKVDECPLKLFLTKFFPSAQKVGHPWSKTSIMHSIWKSRGSLGFGESLFRAKPEFEPKPVCLSRNRNRKLEHTETKTETEIVIIYLLLKQL